MALKELQVMVVEDHGFQRRIAVRLLAELGVVKVLEGWPTWTKAAIVLQGD